MKRLILAIFIGLFICQWGVAQENSSDSIKNINHSQTFNYTKAEGDSAYIHNNYRKAIDIYEHLLQNGESPILLYNLGNAYYKNDDIAKSILSYERALLLDPSNSDIKANLEIARAKTKDKIMPVGEIFFVSWYKSIMHLFSISTWAKIGIFSFIFFLLSLYMYFFSRNKTAKICFFYIAILLIIISILANIFAYQQNKSLMSKKYAIIMSPSITVTSTPSTTGTPLFIIHEGHKVKIKDNSMKEWKEIELEDGKVGWVPQSAIEEI